MISSFLQNPSGFSNSTIAVANKSDSSCSRFFARFLPLAGTVFALLVLALCSQHNANGIVASPFPVDLAQPDGSKVTLHVRGDEFYNWFEDKQGFSVVRDQNRYVYARLDAKGDLVPTDLQVGKADPAAHGLAKKLKPTAKAKNDRRSRMFMPHGAQGVNGAKIVNPDESVLTPPGLQRITPIGRVKNLVILCKFSDHTDNVHTRPESDYDILFNNVGPHPTLAPSGSVKDCYTENSYGLLNMESTVLAWVTLPQSEAYYANSQNGFGFYPQNAQGMVKDALDLVDPLVDFGDFDENNDGYIDAISIVHSGYGAEWNGNPNWIWSHRWTLGQVPGGRWSSADVNANGVNVKVFDYHTEPALWDVTGNEIGRVGVIAHELGHFFGLPDLYDTDGGGEGIGSYCMMANSWGFDFSQLYPPHFSAWSKIQLGWVNPTVIGPGTYQAPLVEANPQVFKISQGFPVGEYLLIENRQPFGFDKLPQGGLCIWHIDEAKGDNQDEGYPGQPGWPGNNQHYSIALLQADGTYDLERGLDRGDSGDVYHGAGVSAITPATVPNTHSYQNGNVVPTAISIENISVSGSSMTFTYNGPGGPGGGGSPFVQFVATTFSVMENSPGFASITITNIGGAAGSVSYATTNGTAVSGVDYIGRTNSITFSDGELSKSFTIPILDNAVVNADKTVNLSLFNPGTGVMLGVSNAVLTINDDERQTFISTAGQFAFSSSSYYATEFETFQGPYGPYTAPHGPVNQRSAKGALITVIRTNGATGRVLIDFTTTNLTGISGVDYSPTNGTLVFDHLQMSTNFLVPVFSDGTENGSKMVGLLLSNPRPAPEEDPNLIIPTLGTRSNAVLNVLEVAVNGTFNIERARYRIDEYGSPDRTGAPAFRTNIVVDVILPGGGPGHVYVRVWRGGNYGYSFPATLQAGSDYSDGFTDGNGEPGGVIFSNPFYTDGQTDIVNLADYIPTIDGNGNNYIRVDFGQNISRRHVVIPIVNDGVVEFNEDIEVELLGNPNPSGPIGENSSAVVTILHDDQAAGALDREWNPDNIAATTPPFNLTPGANNMVRSVAVQQDNKTILGGEFTSVNTVARNRIARMNENGSLDLTFNPGSGADGFVEKVVIDATNRVLIAGGFTSFNGTQRNGIARLLPTGALDTSFAPGNGVDGQIRAMVLQADGKIIIAGEFTTYNDEPCNGIARLNEDGSLDQTFQAGTGPDSSIWAIALQSAGFGPQKIIVAGEFTSFNGITRTRIARLNPDGSVDQSFDSGRGVNDAVYALAVQSNGYIVLGGAFTEIDVYQRNSIARLTPDGAVDVTFDPGDGADDSVYAVTLQPDGRALIGGVFEEYNGTRRIGLARLKWDGTLDTSFMDTAYNHFAGLINPFSFQPRNFINSIALQPDGNLIIGGSFKRIGGNPSDDVNVNLRGGHTKFSRADIRTRHNIARVFGGVTPGPGNIRFISTPYRSDEDAGAMSITLERIDGRLGTIQVRAGTKDNLAIGGQDYVLTNRIERWAEWAYVAPRSVGFIGFNYFEVPILDDNAVEGDETVNLDIRMPSGSITLGGEVVPLGGALSVRDSQMTVVDNDFEHGVFAFSAPAYTVNENGGKASITIVRTNGSTGAVSVDYFTRSGPAPSATPGVGGDYTEISKGTLSFASGQTSRSFTVNITDDPVVEFDENIYVVLTNTAGGAKLPGGLPTSSLTNVLTIIDNDFAAGRLNFSSLIYTNREDVGQAIVTVTRSGGNVGVVSVDYVVGGGSAVHGIDYLGSTNGTLTWVDGDSSPRSITLNLVGPDGLIEGTESIGLALTNVTIAGALGGRTNSVLYIEDADSYGSLAFTQPTYAADENGIAANITVIRTGGVAGTVEVDYAISAGSAIAGDDYVQPPTVGKLVLNPNDTSTNFTVVILDDQLADGDKTVNLQLSNFINATPGAVTNAILTLIDDESFTIPAGNLDVTFDQNVKTDGSIYSLALQPDNRLLIAGDFGVVNDVVRTRIARLRDTGVLDTTFNAGAGPNGSVRSLLLQQDGKVVIGGLFTMVSDTNRNSIARLNIDGTVDAFFNPGAGANNPVYSMALQVDQKIVVGGAFNTYNGVNRFGVARVNTNGTLDVSFNPGTGANGPVYAVAVQKDGKILVGGDFTSFNGTARSYFVRLNANGTVDATLANPSINAAVRAIYVQPDGKIVIGGSFTSVAGTTRNYLARLNANGALDSSFLNGKSGANNVVYAIAQQVDGKLMVAGDFTTFNGVTRNRLTRLINDSFNDGATDPTINFGLGCDNFVNALLIQPDRKIVFAGGFTTYDEKPRKFIARIHGGSIAGSGAIEFRAPIIKVSEGETNAVVTLRRIGGTTAAVSNNFATANGTAQSGTHYLAAAGTLVFPEGETRQTFNVPILNDQVVNEDRTVNLSLSQFAGGAVPGPQSTATLLIVNDDSIFSFNTPTYNVNENAVSGYATIGVARSGATNTTAAISYSTVPGGSATINADYGVTNGTLVFLPGEALKNFNVPVVDDAFIENSETVNLLLSNPQPASSAQLDNSKAAATLQIVDNDFGPGELSFAATNFFVDEYQRAGVTIVRSNGSTGVISVRFNSSDNTALAGPDYIATNNVISFADGEVSKTIFIDIVNDNILEPDEKFMVSLSQPQGGAALGVLTNTFVTILDDDIMIVPAGSALLSESLTTNNIIEPGETVRFLFGLRNAGRVNVANLTATLQTNAGISPTNLVTQTYGFMPTNSFVVSREFSFRANGTNGTRIHAVLDLRDNGVQVGTATFSYTLGQAGTVFANTNTIVVNDNTTANPYPSVIDVSGVAGPITKLTVMLTNVTHAYPDDLNVLLVGPTGQTVMLIGNVGGNASMTNVTLTFDDAGASLPDSSAVSSGTYRPTKYGVTIFPEDAPAAPYGTTLASFNGTLANGLWKLYVLDDLPQDAGTIKGWSLAISSTDIIVPGVDLSATLSSTATDALVGGEVEYIVAITNHGPATATNVTLSANFSSDVTLRGAINAVAVQNGSRSITCTIAGSLTNGATADVRLRVSPLEVGLLESTVVVASAQVEGFNGNNSSVLALSVGSAPVVTISFNGSAMELKWPVAASGYVLETSEDLVNWSPAADVPVEASGYYVVTPATSSDKLFYRLRAP